MASRPPVFDETVSSWSTYRIRLEAYFEGNEITDSAKRRALLVSSLSDNVVRLLQGRLSTVSVNSRTYEQIVEYLEEQYNPQVNETAASFSFFMRKQQEGHLAKVCSQGRSRATGAFAVEPTEGESEEEMLLALVAHSSGDGATLKPREENLTWQGRTLRMIIDTGSPVSVIPMNIFEKHRKWWPALEKTSLRLTCFLGPLPVVGRITMKVQSGSTVVESTVIVVGCQGPLLCGRNTIEAFRRAGVSLWDDGNSSSVNVVRENAEVNPLLEEFSDLFEDKLGCCRGPPVKLHLKEGARPRFCKARTVPYAMRAKVSAEIDRLVQDEVLSPVSVSEWATPVVPVAKKNGDIRLCGDFKLTVNPASHLEQYPLPKVEDIFAALSGGEVFTTLDLRNAYNQLPLDAEARKTTVLNTHRGLYCYNRLAFGIASAPALFQRRMESILLGVPNVQVYLDDIIVAEKRNDTSVLRQVFQRLRENNLKLNKAKCRFREAQVSFLGHRIDADGLHPLQDNLEAVLAAPKPASQLVDSTNDDALLRQVKTWILRGWPKQLGQEQQGFLPYFTRRRELT
ncbi:uncharacterized protein K02A2.6-like, partial [Rhipicephalus sanguineus]|uniref:uncharacterized protein K02A2.6-like n=1 Tax=Rhipicephalus sanguineus TaxID=34632 RepID=UPI0020C1FDB5